MISSALCSVLRELQAVASGRVFREGVAMLRSAQWPIRAITAIRGYRINNQKHCMSGKRMSKKRTIDRVSMSLAVHTRRSPRLTTASEACICFDAYRIERLPNMEGKLEDLRPTPCKFRRPRRHFPLAQAFASLHMMSLNAVVACAN